MNWRILILGVFSLVITSCGTNGGLSTSKNDHAEDEAKIKKNAKAYEEAYNKGDAEKVASFWASDADYIIPDSGETIKGRTKLAAYFKEFFADEDHPVIAVVVDNITFQGPDQAIENGHVTFTYPDGEQGATTYRAENIKENGAWVLKNVREVDTGQANSNFDQLHDLDWLVGSWKNSEDDTVVELDFKWDKNKNFLIEHFAVKILDQDAINGIQVIGWDPIQNTIRSWVFDSDGGFREGTWSNEDGGWVAPMASTQADGLKASSIDVYKKIDQNNFSFSMISRDVDGEMLPDVGPVTFTKTK